ncbi:MAG: DbpA RNA binding domain-containing protein [Treponema sp.]|mgnify:FL=1|uniref:DbpA RNA binding domain-containing protein n=1 Tax=Treponema sp. TaxID=166 RepID=UPI001B4DF9A9|nr:DbpA RNA binding domain-containing protein [Treponema sp.]MBP3771884.1 DbpA RNA binding domain-containing protein [Treponema sp.]MBQ9282762.1 DbpA RNA binding domain-containing protein [Treponema sp.]
MAFRRNFRRNFRQNREIDLDQAANYLKDLVSKVKANPDELEALKKVFKKNVPLTLRSYVAAYLLRNAGGAIFRFNNYKEREDFHANREERYKSYERTENQSDENETEGRENRERFTRVQIPAENSEVVFVSIGRNRRVFPRDLVGLFISVAGIEKERIGDIRVLANYSFVQLFKEDAEKAISALNGHVYRGRALSVSYSKQRPEGDESADADIYENNEPVPNVSNESAPIVDSYTATNSDTVAQQAAFAAQQAQMTDEEILAARAPRSSSSSDIL